VFTEIVLDPLAAVAPVRVDSSNALVAVAETVVLLASPDTEMLKAFEAVTESPGTGKATAVAEVVPPVAAAPAMVSVCVFADAGTADKVAAVSAVTTAIVSLDSFIYLLILII
jgi:hypothetical protein